MLDGRVKTLHPRVHAGILARRHVPTTRGVAAHGIGLDRPRRRQSVSVRAGGARSRLPFDAWSRRSTSAGHARARRREEFRGCARRRSTRRLPALLAELDRVERPAARVPVSIWRGRRSPIRRLRRDDRDDARASRGRTDRRVRPRDRRRGRDPRLLTSRSAQRCATALRRESAPAGGVVRGRIAAGFGRATVLQGKELSFTNLLDLDAAARIVLEFDEPAAAVIKHTNPCGVATGDSIAEAYVRARDADPLSAFGGIVGLNRPIDVETAARAHRHVHRGGRGAGRRCRCRAPCWPQSPTCASSTLTVAARRVGDREPHELRSILGGVLVQARDSRGRGRHGVALGGLERSASRDPARAERRGMAALAIRLARAART